MLPNSLLELRNFGLLVLCMRHAPEQVRILAVLGQPRLPGMHAHLTALSLPFRPQALYQADGGILASERCIRAHVTAAQARGALLHERETVQSWYGCSLARLCGTARHTDPTQKPCTGRAQ